ncbi:MAG: hypothetical protein ACI9VM_000894 [Candidatus Azotimanducaceae bacterium]|jgi:hypothetical protein
MEFDPNKITFFAKTDARGQEVPFGIKAIDRLRHMYVIGKTGMGKSTLLENMAVQDMQSGEGMAFIDPHGATAETLLDYIPEHRKKDVVYFAPFDAEHPIAFNVMEDVGPEKRHLVVSGLMSVFKKIWVDAWSARMEYILQNTLLALLEYPDSTLLGVNRMLSEKVYRKKVINNISDPAVKSFWVDEFLNYNERYMQEAGDAIKNKIGQFTANPLIRNIIGQPKSSFDLREIMDQRKIIIMNLSKGLVGESNANLLGSMLTTRLYLAAMSRADLSQADMRAAPNFYFYVDEFQSFANATFADILSEARKYKLNLTIAHQYIEQMEEEVRNAVFGNVGTIVSFRVGPFDAEVLETIYAPQFYAVDICNLGFAQVYLTLMIDGIGSKPFSGVTLPPIEPATTSCKEIIIHTSREQFARPRAEVEAAIIAWHAPSTPLPSNNTNSNTSSKSVSNGKRSETSAPRKFDNNRAVTAHTPYVKETRAVPASNERTEVRAAVSTSRSDRPTYKSPNSVSENAVAKKEGDRPKESLSTPPSQGRTSAPVKRESSTPNGKNLDDLRAVLAGLSKSDEKKVEKKESVPSAPQKQNATSDPQVRTNQVTQEDKEDAAALKRALQSKHTQHTDRRTQKPDASKEKQERPPVQPVAEVVKNELQRDLVQNTPQQPSVQRTKDELDPKVLERMMRVNTSDKTPLK